MKWIVRLVGGLVVVVLVLLVVLNFFMGSIVKKSAETIGPSVLGVDVRLDEADFSLFRGRAQLKGMLIGNPEGFKTPSMFELGEILIELKPLSILTDTIVIDRIFINAPRITYEQAARGNNIGKLIEQLEGEPPAEGEEAPAEKPEPEEPAEGKKVVINELVIDHGRVNVSLTALRGQVIPVPLPRLQMNDIGKEKEGASVKEVITTVLEAIAKSATEVVGASIDVLGKGAEAAGDLLKGGAEMGGDAARQAAEGVKDLGGSIGEGAGRALDKLGGSIRRDRDKDKKE